MFDFKKNVLVGAVFLVFGVILRMFWGPAESFLRVWDPLVEILQTIANYLGFPSVIVHLPDPFGSGMHLVLGAVFWVLIVFLVGVLFRGIGLYVASDLGRAQEITRVAKRLHLGWAWRLTVGLAILADALSDLYYVRTEEYRGKRRFGLITKVQRVHHQGTGRSWFEFIVYNGGFPAYFFGSWNWYAVKNCQKVIDALSEMVVTFASVGLAAPSDLAVDDFSEEDLKKINQRLKEKEKFLVASGLVDPDQGIEGV